MPPVKTKRVWKVKTVETRYLEAYLNGLDFDGATVFVIIPSINVSGATEVVSFSKEPVVVTEPMAGIAKKKSA